MTTARRDALDASHRIVADGHRRAWDANIARVRAEVEREFAAALATTDLVRRILLRIEIELEIARRMERVAPPGALYAMTGTRPNREHA